MTETPRPTVKDIARAAGVSPRTVSNVVNGFVHVAEETRSRVLAECARLGYRPNLAARHLRNGRSSLLGLVVPDIGQPYFSGIARAFENAARSREQSLLIVSTGGTLKGERDAIGRLLALGMLDGILLSLVHLDAREAASSLSLPCVFLGPAAVDPTLAHVAIDNHAAAFLATNHLLDQGCRNIAAIGVRKGSGPASERRLQGYLAAHAARGIPAGEKVETADFTRQAGAEAMAALLSHSDKPDGVFCFSDLLALGALHTVHGAGLSIPGDIRIVGYDNIEESAWCAPTLSTIGADNDALAETALNALADRASGFIGLPMRLIHRRSS